MSGAHAIGPLYDLITWYNITHAVEQVVQSGTSCWTGTSFIVLELVPLCNLLISMCGFVQYPVTWNAQ